MGKTLYEKITTKLSEGTKVGLFNMLLKPDKQEEIHYLRLEL